MLDFPANPTVDQVFDKWTWNGSTWNLTPVSQTGGGGGSGFTYVTDIAPPPAKIGDTWFDTSTAATGGTSWVAIEEAPGGELVWVQFAPGAGTPAALEPLPKGVVAWKGGTFTSVAIATTPITVYSLTAALKAGRCYEFSATGRALYTANNVQVGLVCAPVIAGFAMDVWTYAPGPYSHIAWSTLCFPTVTQTYTISISVQGSSAGFFWNDGGCYAWIRDMGAAVAQSP